MMNSAIARTPAVTIAVMANKNQESANSQQVVPADYKRCPHCGRVLPISEFGKCKSSKDGHQTQCKDCVNQAQRERFRKRKQAQTESQIAFATEQIPQGYKRCNKCGKIKPLEDFDKSKDCKDGHRGTCKECRKETLHKSKGRKQIAKEHKEQEDIEIRKQSVEDETVDMARPKLPFDYARRIMRAQALCFAPDTQECRQCHKVKPMTEFQTDNRRLTHLAPICKSCMSANRKSKYQIRKQQLQQLIEDKQRLEEELETKQHELEECKIKNEEMRAKLETTPKPVVSTFEYLTVGTELYYLSQTEVFKTNIKSIKIIITSEGSTLAYLITLPNNKDISIYHNEIGKTAFLDPIQLVNRFIKMPAIH